MSGLVLAVDGGSQSTKVSVVDDRGRVHASARRALRPYELGAGGRAVHPDDDLWDSLAATCREALAALVRAGGDPRRIRAVGLCGIRSCRALLDADGRLLEPVLSWMDARIAHPVEDLDPTVALVCSAGGYLAVRLTGERRDSAATYDGRWPLDLLTRDWSGDPDRLATHGVPAHLLPELVDPAALLGRVTEQAAAATGLPVGLGVHATANDKAVEALGAGLAGQAGGPVLLSLGTYVAAMACAAHPGADAAEDDRRWVNAAAVPGTYLHESGGVRHGMGTVTWWRRLLGAAGASGGASGASGASTPTEREEALLTWLEQGAAAVAPGSGGLATLPDWLPPAGEPWRRGAMLGLGAEHGPHEVHRSILEGLALRMRGHVEALEASLDRAPGELLVSGGGSASSLTMQLLADALDRPTRRLRVPDAAGTGAAICAAVGAGLHPDAASAAAAMVRLADRFEPDPRAAVTYTRLAAVHAALPALTAPALERLVTP